MHSKVYSPREAWEQLGIGRTRFYQLLKEGRIRFFKNGNRYLIPESSIAEYISKQISQCMKGDEQ